MPPRRATYLLTALLPVLMLGGCFTGVESTPRITYKEVERQKAAATAEQALAEEFAPRPFARWAVGDSFAALSPLAGRAFAGAPDIPRGATLTYAGERQRVWVLGETVVELLFTTAALPGDTLAYNTQTTLAALRDRREPPAIPYVADLAMVARTDSALAGRVCYIKTDLWNNPADGGAYTRGPKYIPVTITRVTTGTATHPLRVEFTTADGAAPHTGMVLMAPRQGSGAVSRTFDTLFSFTDPRDRYPDISDAHWELICHSRVTDGMTRAEARLAYGHTSEVDRGHTHSTAYERWTYPDGRYLIFEDGILTRHN